MEYASYSGRSEDFAGKTLLLVRHIHKQACTTFVFATSPNYINDGELIVALRRSLDAASATSDSWR